MSNTERLQIRAHHLICIFGWRQEGYDWEFTNNFNRVYEGLIEGVEIILAEGADDICRPCPWLREGRCRAQAYGDGPLAQMIDNRLSGRLGINVGRTYDSLELLRKIEREITPQSLREICSGCAWLENGWCVQGLKSGLDRLDRRLSERSST